MPSQLSLFYATSLEISQIARWCRTSPENTPSGLPVVNEQKDLMIKDDGMALCLYDDTMKMWSTVSDWIPQWSEMGKCIADVIEKNPTIKSSWDKNINHLNMGYESLQNFREDMWVENDGSVRPVSSPFMLANTLDEEVKKMEAAYINLPYDDDTEEARLPDSPLSSTSDSATTPPLSPSSPFESPDFLCSSPSFLPGLPFETPFHSTLGLPPSIHQTISPLEIFSPLPQVAENADDAVVEEIRTPPTPVVPTLCLPEEMDDECIEATPLVSHTSLPSRSPSPPVAGPSRSPLKRPRRSEGESEDESDEFIPQTRKKNRAGKLSKAGNVKRASGKFEGKGTVCGLCGIRLGRATDLPRHKASCKSNPGRLTRETPCEVCGKLLPVRPDAIKRHLESKTCRSKRKKGDDEDPYLSES